MTTASSALRPSDARSYVPVLAIASLAMFGALLGMALAMGELDALYVSLSVIASIAVLFDFRIGAVLLILVAPIEASSFFPHGIMGITGLNPINLLVGGTLVSFLLRGKTSGVGRFVPRPLWWLFIVPILVGGVMGVRNVDAIPEMFVEEGILNFTDGVGYFRDITVKPLITVLIALLVGAALSRAQKPERFLGPIIAAVWIMALLAVGYVAASGVSLGELASASSRAFFSGVGMHANDLGRLYAVAYALLLFTWADSKSQALKSMLIVTMGVLVMALLLTFSRGAFLGFVVVNLLFLLWKFNSKTLVLALLVATVAVFFLPGAVMDRVSLGLGSGNANEVSAGRIDSIWIPLLPWFADSPLWGHGLQSTMWSDPLRQGLMFQVTHPHNAYLEALLDLGVIGTGLLIAYYVHVWKGFRALGSNAYLAPAMRGFYQGAAAGLVSFAVTGFAGSSLYPRPEYVFLWLAIGMMYGQLARRPAE